MWGSGNAAGICFCSPCPRGQFSLPTGMRQCHGLCIPTAWMRILGCFFYCMWEKLPIPFIRYKVTKIQVQASGMEPLRDAAGETCGAPRSPSQTDIPFPSRPFFLLIYVKMMTQDVLPTSEADTKREPVDYYQRICFWKLRRRWELTGFFDSGTMEAPKDQGQFLSASSWAKGLGYPGRAYEQQCWEAV